MQSCNISLVLYTIAYYRPLRSFHNASAYCISHQIGSITGLIKLWIDYVYQISYSYHRTKVNEVNLDCVASLDNGTHLKII